ncbi:hypothetical protein B0O80DRAFT_445704 [Mortierella sp. GBAus27b]|nr:hypothetical protein BGX31_009874 [Mortierella sp. GBA43]KAI8357737.1 hypothetical protein B0O80DRAFT_445704 [Mortierella sp. GBAus27b]
MKAVASLTIVSALASLAAAFINPVDPWGDSKWVPKSQVTIKWTNDATKPALTADHVFDIILATGGDQKHIYLSPPVATGVKAGSVDSVTYTVPVVDPPGKIYFLVFNQTAGPKDAASNGQAYTTRFTITDTSGNPGTLAPTGPVGQNPGGVGSIVAGTSSAGPAATGTTTAGAANPSATAAGSTTSPSTGKSGAATLGVSAMSAVVAVAAGAAAFIGF